MAEQKAKTIRELDSFETGQLSLNDYLIVASNSAGPNITRKATLEEIFQKYTAQQTGGDGFGELVDQGVIDVISEGAPIWEAEKGSQYVTIRTFFYAPNPISAKVHTSFNDRVNNFFKPGATVDIDGDHYIVEEGPVVLTDRQECKEQGLAGICLEYWYPYQKIKLTTSLSRTYQKEPFGDALKSMSPVNSESDYDKYIFIKEIAINTTESSPNASASAANLYDGALDIKSKVQKLKGDPSRTSKVGAITFDMSQITAYNLQDYVDATANGSGLQVIYDCYNASGNPVDCASGAVSVKSKRLSMVGYTGEIVNNIAMSNSETIVSGMVEDLQGQGEIDTPNFQINKFILPKQISKLENGLIVNSQYYIGAFLEYGGYVGGKWYALQGSDQFPDLGYGLFFMDNAYDPNGTWIFFAEPQSWFYLSSDGITAPSSFEQPYIGWWMYHNDLKWHWTNPNIYPFAYVHAYFKGTQDLVGWIYFETKESTSNPDKQFSRTGKIYIYDQTSGNGSRSKWVNLNDAAFDPATPAVSGPTAPTLSNSIKNAYGTDAPVVSVPAR